METMKRRRSKASGAFLFVSEKEGRNGREANTTGQP